MFALQSEQSHGVLIHINVKGAFTLSSFRIIFYHKLPKNKRDYKKLVFKSLLFLGQPIYRIRNNNI